VNRIVSVLAGAVALSAVALPATADARAARPAVAIHVTSGERVAAPDSLRPGLVHLRNSGTKQIYLVRRVAAKWGVSTLVKDYNATTSSAIERHFFSVDTLLGHRDAFVPLVRGTYFFVAADLMKIGPANVHAVVVKGTRWNSPKPVSTAVPISGTAAKLGAPSSLPTHRYLHFTNPTRYAVVVVLFRIGPKTSNAKLAAFVAKPTLTGLGRLDLRWSEELWFSSPHGSLYYGYHATAGRYLMIDYAYTDTSQKPRFGKGQAVAVRVR
jgi:hypothetical protein